MPLSSDEERIFKEMEDGLISDKKASAQFAVPFNKNGTSYTKIVIGVLIIVVGIVGLIIGVALKLPIVGLVGFIAMFTGVYIAASEQFDARKR
jgi:hypothetical protein